MIYSVPYLLLITFYGIMALWYGKTENQATRPWNILLCIFVTLVFWGFRGFCFYDWMSYYPMFLKANFTELSSNVMSTEPAFCLLMTLCKAVCNNYVFFTFVCTVIDLVLLSKFLLKYTDNYPLAMMIGTVFGCFFMFTDLLRNGIAMFIFINAIEYIVERKPLKYFSMVLISVSFHYSAVMYVPLYFFGSRRTSRLVFGMVFFAGVVLYVLHVPLFMNLSTFLLGFVNPYLEGKVRYYMENVMEKSGGLNFVFFEQVFTGILVLCYMDKLREVRKEANVFINCLLMFFVMTFYMNEFVTLSTRLAMLFGVGYWVIWGDLLKCITIKSNRRLFVFFIFVYCFLRVLGNTRNPMAKYENVLFDYSSYQMRQSYFNKNFKGN